MVVADKIRDSKFDNSSAHATPPRSGKVILVGAGPGDPDLLTVRAVQWIRTGDVLVYDRLIHPDTLALAKSSAEKIYMGKPQGHHARQDEIHALLVAEAREGK